MTILECWLYKEERGCWKYVEFTHAQRKKK